MRKKKGIEIYGNEAVKIVIYDPDSKNEQQS